MCFAVRTVEIPPTIMNLPTWLQSSQDPTEVANKVKGAIVVASSAIIYGAAHVFHITLTADDITTLATEISGVIGAVWFIYGIVLNLITFFAKKTALQS